jgi:hypothetical protein
MNVSFAWLINLWGAHKPDAKTGKLRLQMVAPCRSRLCLGAVAAGLSFVMPRLCLRRPHCCRNVGGITHYSGA